MTGRSVVRYSAQGYRYRYWEVEPTPRIPDELLGSVVFMYPNADAAIHGGRVGGTGFLLGWFISHSSKQTNQPLARFGNIAMMPGEKVVDGRGLRVEAYLVEMRSLSGYSGSPVFVYLAPGSYRGEGKGMMPFYQEAIGMI